MKTCILLALCLCVASVGAQTAAFMPSPMETTSSTTVRTMSFACHSGESWNGHSGITFRSTAVMGNYAPSPSLRRVEILIGAAVPSYVPASSGDLNPFDVQGSVARRNGPPTTGGTVPDNPDIKQPTPIGDALLFLMALLGLYGLFLHIRRAGQLRKNNSLKY